MINIKLNFYFRKLTEINLPIAGVEVIGWAGGTTEIAAGWILIGETPTGLFGNEGGAGFGGGAIPVDGTNEGPENFNSINFNLH